MSHLPNPPSPFGVRVLKLIMHIQNILSLYVSVPFRGSCSEMASVIPTGKLLKVSVPFRGSCSETDINRFDLGDKTKFPSPFGVHVLKDGRLGYQSVGFLPCFRPLSGFMFWKEHTLLSDNAKLSDVLFPSPFGVHVLKASSVSIKCWIMPSFRPLSGFMFWKATGCAFWRFSFPQSVSVPFRGSCSESLGRGSC